MHLLENLLSMAQSSRYKVDEVLRHPWISRRFNSPMPESPMNKKIRMIKCYHLLTKVR